MQRFAYLTILFGLVFGQIAFAATPTLKQKSPMAASKTPTTKTNVKQNVLNSIESSKQVNPKLTKTKREATEKMLLGQWQAKNKKSALIQRVTIKRQGKLLAVTAWGKCVKAKICKWGVVYSNNNKTDGYISLQPLKNGHLLVSAYNIFNNAGSYKQHRVIEEMKKV